MVSYTEIAGSSEKHDWETPKELFDALDAEFHFQTDLCAVPSTAKCRRFFTPNENGLSQQWTGMCWANPPYGNQIPKWVEKAYRSACEGHATVVLLIPARTDTRWFHNFCVAGEIRFLKGRVQYVGSKYPAPFPNMIVIFHAHLDPGGIMRSWDWRPNSDQLLMDGGQGPDET